MKCLECQDWLQQRLDGSPVAEEKDLEQHLAGCPSCREQHAAATKLLRGLQHLGRPSAPPELATRVAAAVLRDRAVRRWRMTRRLYVTAALAASVVLMLLFSYVLQPAHTPAPPEAPPQQAKRPAPEPRPHEAPEPKEERQAALPESLVDRTREQLQMLLPAIAPEDAVERLAELDRLDPATQSLRHAGQEVTASVQTVTRSARQAFDYFSRELPVFDLTTRE